MPTGYTADVADGKVTDFRTFALRCARAFGATIMQRDDNANDPPRHREVSDYERKRVNEAEAEFKRFITMTLAEAGEASRAEHAAEVARRAEYRHERDEKRGRYEAMLVEVRAWLPPTTEHVEMKNFMEKQIMESIEFDCGGDYWSESKDPVLRTAAEWLHEKRQQAAKDLGRAVQSLAEEEARCAGANAWIDALYESLPADLSSAQARRVK